MVDRSPWAYTAHADTRHRARLTPRCERSAGTEVTGHRAQGTEHRAQRAYTAHVLRYPVYPVQFLCASVGNTYIVISLHLVGRAGVLLMSPGSPALIYKITVSASVRTPAMRAAVKASDGEAVRRARRAEAAMRARARITKPLRRRERKLLKRMRKSGVERAACTFTRK